MEVILGHIEHDLNLFEITTTNNFRFAPKFPESILFIKV